MSAYLGLKTLDVWSPPIIQVKVKAPWRSMPYHTTFSLDEAQDVIDAWRTHDGPTVTIPGCFTISSDSDTILVHLLGIAKPVTFDLADAELFVADLEAILNGMVQP